MEQRIQKAYASAPKTWLWQLLAAFIVACLLAWSGTAVTDQQPHQQRSGGSREYHLRYLPSLRQAAVHTGHQRCALSAAGDVLHRLSGHHRGRGDLAAPCRLSPPAIWSPSRWRWWDAF